jgi:hypothetical protein
MLSEQQESRLTKIPHYSAVLRDWDSNDDLGPVDVSTPYREDNDVKAVALMNALTWCTDNGVDRVRVQIMVLSRFMLELSGASSGDMRLSDHAARSMI